MPRAATPRRPMAMPPAPERPGERLRDHALGELARAMEQLAREGDARHSGVHQARKSLRRTRACLDLARRALGEKGHRLDRSLASLCRGLGALRDAQALVEALRRLEPSAAPGLAALLPRAQSLAAARRDERLAGALARDPDFGRRRQRLENLQARLAALPWETLREDGISAALGRSQRRLAKARRRVERHPGDDERWHGLRRRLRRLRQQDTVLSVVMPALCSSSAGLADEAAALGKAQDDVLLLRHCGRHSPFPPKIRRAIRAAARTRLANMREGKGRS